MATTLPFNCLYANVPFCVDQAQVVRMNLEGSPILAKDQEPLRKHQAMADLVDELNRIIPFRYLKDFTLPGEYQGRNLGAMAIQDAIGPDPTPGDIKIGDFYYPTTASRWSVFRGLATSGMTKAMLAATQGKTFATFIMSQSPISPNNPNPKGNTAAYAITTKMYMLPPRPLSELGGGKFDGLYLITLVDERYYFQGTPVILRPTRESTWANMAMQIAGVLSINLTVPSVPTVYTTPEPDSQLWTNFENSATLLDAIAFNVGSTVVRNFDGTYVFQTPEVAAAIVNQNRGNANKVVRTAGGNIFEGSGTKLPVGDLTLAKNAVVPAEVLVTFPKYVFGDDPVPHYVNPRYQNQRPSAWYEESYGDAYVVDVPIQMGGINVSGLVGVSTKVIHNTAKALYFGEMNAASGMLPINMSGLTALSLQIAQDYYNNQVITALDEVYPGIVNWSPEGIHDIIWTYSARERQAVTRVIHSEWTQQVTDFQHAGPPLSGCTVVPKGVGGPSVAQSWRDQQKLSGQIFTSISQTLSSGSYQIILRDYSYLPTQNRWRGLVDQEIILFEGTSGGVGTVDIAYRGVDGSIQTMHDNGTNVYQLFPDTTYGVNLVTHEKSQFVYQGIWTSGGINEAVVVPQIQTVHSFDNVGILLNQTQHYSGILETYDTTKPMPFSGKEYVWLVERNNEPIQSGKRYDGQLAGYSIHNGIPSSTSPVYLINDCGDTSITLKGKTIDQIPACSGTVLGQGTVEVYYDNGSNLVDAGYTVPVKNNSYVPVPSNTFVDLITEPASKDKLVTFTAEGFQLNSSGTVIPRPILNVILTSGSHATLSDDSPNNRVNLSLFTSGVVESFQINSTTPIYNQPTLNLVSSGGVGLGITNDVANKRVTISLLASGGNPESFQINSITPIYTEPTLNMIAGSGVLLGITDSPLSGTANIYVNTTYPVLGASLVMRTVGSVPAISPVSGGVSGTSPPNAGWIAGLGFAYPEMFNLFGGASGYIWDFPNFGGMSGSVPIYNIGPSVIPDNTEVIGEWTLAEATVSGQALAWTTYYQSVESFQINTTTPIYTEPRLNLIAGSGITLGITDSPLSGTANISITAPGGGAGSSVTAARIHKNGTTTIPNNVATNLTFDVTDYDTTGSISNNGGFVIPSDGVYHAGGYIYLPNGGSYSVNIQINNTSAGRIVSELLYDYTVVSTPALKMGLSGDDTFSNGDSIALTVTQGSLSSQPVEGYFWIHKID